MANRLLGIKEWDAEQKRLKEPKLQLDIAEDARPSGRGTPAARPPLIERA